jgi:putative dimethyl sulfoxide reductase chaperone
MSGLDNAWRELAADDVELLARMHDREADQAWLDHLRSAPAGEWLNLNLDDAEDAKAAYGFLDEALAGAAADARLLDDLAAEYANIYLNCRYQASPTESYWLDDERLERQAPMFAVRRWYQDYGIKTENWRIRPDDHLVLELAFIVHLLRLDGETATLKHAAQFLDQHLLRWIKDFSSRIVLRCNSAFYAGANILTASYLDRLRDVLVIAANEPRAVVEGKRAGNAQDAGKETPYAPGHGPGW